MWTRLLEDTVPFVIRWSDRYVITLGSLTEARKFQMGSIRILGRRKYSVDRVQDQPRHRPAGST